MPSQNGEFVRQRQNVRQEIARVIHELDRRLAVLDADMHVQPKIRLARATSCMSSTIFL